MRDCKDPFGEVSEEVMGELWEMGFLRGGVSGVLQWATVGSLEVVYSYRECAALYVIFASKLTLAYV